MNQTIATGQLSNMSENGVDLMRCMWKCIVNTDDAKIDATMEVWMWSELNDKHEQNQTCWGKCDDNAAAWFTVPRRKGRRQTVQTELLGVLRVTVRVRCSQMCHLYESDAMKRWNKL